MNAALKRIVFAGAGNVGLQAILALGLVITASPADHWLCFVVDFDQVKEKDTRKGYPVRLTGWLKAEAAVELVRLLYGEKTAAHFIPVVAAAQSAPGLFRDAEAVFNGTDSTLDAAYVSEESRNAWEVRMSTGILGGSSVHSIEIMPAGCTLGDASYDTPAWADTARHECKFGLPVNSFAGVAQPFGALVGALAVHLFLCSRRETRSRHHLLRVYGEEIIQSFGTDTIQPCLRVSEEIRLSYEAPFGRLWSEIAMRLGVDHSEVLLEFPVPLVTRVCGNGCEEPYRGFERQPPTGDCLVCGGKTFCLASPREATFVEVHDITAHTLRQLHAPAGLRLTAHTKDGNESCFHLAFCEEDIPGLAAREGSAEPMTPR
jgi:hypothetical protein